MATLSDREKMELLRLAGDHALREDMEYLANHRHNPLVIDGKVDLDRLIAFLTQYNEFLNHAPKPFKPFEEREMKL